MKKLILNLLLFAALLQNYTPLSAQNSCTIPSKTETLDINNARVTYNNWGTEWLKAGALGWYEIPKGSGASSAFAGGFIFAGIDENDSLRLNAHRFGQTPEEQSLRPGPVTLDNLGNYVMPENCEPYDRIFKISRTEVVIHRLYFQMLSANGGVPPTTHPFENGYEIPAHILDWPAHTELIPGQMHYMAPFFESDCCGGTPGIYEPHLGDYPAFKFDDNAAIFDCEQHLLGDQVLWWIFNDSRGALTTPITPWTQIFNPLGIEVHNMAYAYISNNHLNNTTFLRRHIINRSSHNYHDAYHGQMIDVDLGGADDDYFGSEVQRGMAYFYNGDMNDESQGAAIGYGITPPAIGFDWVGGPLADENDGIDNNWNGVIDEPGERHRLDFSFLMTNNAPAAQTDPHSDLHYYNYLSGKWRDGTPLSYGGTSYNPNNPNAINVKMSFTGDSDPLGLNTGGIVMPTWSEISESNPPGDRRTYISSGPFSFNSGEEKIFTMAIVWAREEPCVEVPCSLELLFEANDFAQAAFDDCFEFECQIVDTDFYIEVENGYAQFSSPITTGLTYTWTFGDGNVVVTEYPITNYQYEDGGNIQACLEIDFGCGTSIACKSLDNLLCDLLLGPELTQIEGMGNTRNFMELTEQTIAAILSNDSSMVLHPTFKKGKGPVKVLVYDWDALVEGNYVLRFDGIEQDSNWKLYLEGSNDTIYNEVSIGTPYVQYIPQWGLSVSVDAHDSNFDSEAIGASIEFENSQQNWLSQVSDADGFTFQNWIRQGNFVSYSSPYQLSTYPCFYIDEAETTLDPYFFSDVLFEDGSEDFEQLINGGWTPSYYTKSTPCHPYFSTHVYIGNPHNKPGVTRNVDVILTPDKNLWSRSLVFDMSYGPEVSSSNKLRTALSVDKNGRNQTDPNCNVAEATFNGQQTDPDGYSRGMGWFPGYAIDVNTGKRLNIMFGENPDLINDNGNDMLWNPTFNMWADDGSVIFGGTHSITILSNHLNSTTINKEYDGCQYIFDRRNLGVVPFQTTVSRRQQWTGLPLLNEGFELLPIEQGLIPTETTIKLRLLNRFRNYLPAIENLNDGNPLYNFTINYEDLIYNNHEIESKTQLKLFPNPASTNVNLEITGLHNQRLTANIYNLQGQLVLSKQIESDRINSINTGYLNDGLYLLQIVTQDGARYTQRFVVVK